MGLIRILTVKIAAFKFTLEWHYFYILLSKACSIRYAGFRFSKKDLINLTYSI
jgi:hypothetical protein